MGFNFPEQVPPHTHTHWTSTGPQRYGKHWRVPWEARAGTMPVRAPDGAPAEFCRLFEKNICVQTYQAWDDHEKTTDVKFP